MDTISRSKEGSDHRRTWRDHFRWELGWSAVELCGVAAGLSLGLGLGLWGPGGMILAGVLATSFVVRSQHYGASSMPTGGP